MALPFTYQRVQRRPVDNTGQDQMVSGMDSTSPQYPEIQPYTEDQDPKVAPQQVQPPAAAPEQAPAVDPALIKQAFPPPTPVDLTETAPPVEQPQRPGPTRQELGAPPIMISQDNGRPDEAIGGASDMERNQALLSSVRKFEPQKAHGWRRYLAPILAGWAAGQKGNASPWAGLGGAIVGGLSGQFRPKQADENWQKKKEEEVSGDIDSDMEQQKQIAQLQDIQQRPVLREREQTRKEGRDDMLRDQQEWSRRFAERKQDTYEDYVAWRKANGDRRADTADGLRQLRSEYQQFEQQFKTRVQDNRERHEKVTEAQTWKRLDLTKANAGGQAQFRTKFNQAKQAINRFNDLTRRATQAASWNDAQGKTNEAALLMERDQLEKQIRDQYGDFVVSDDKGKPSQLRRMWSASAFKTANPGRDVKAAQSAAENEGAIIVP